MLNLNPKRKSKYLQAQRQEDQKRLTGQKRLTVEEREIQRAKKLQYKDRSELKLRGGFERIYPLMDEKLQEQNMLDLQS